MSGEGVVGTVRRRRVALGNLAFFEDLGIAPDDLPGRAVRLRGLAVRLRALALRPRALLVPLRNLAVPLRRLA